MSLRHSFWLSLTLLLSSPIVHARLLQIIHTNDLHSHFTGYHDGRGGYDKLLTKIKEIRAAAQAKNVEVLQLDGGDWGEGNAFFHNDEGVTSLKALELLGTEVSTIGNHDHILGGSALTKMLKAAKVRTKFVVANLQTTPEMGLEQVLTPHVDLEKAGIKIRVIGLTTPESWFQYSMLPGKVLYPNAIGEAQAKKAKADGRELVIALTHLGLYADESLAANSANIDVIVGGHTHSRLTKVDYIQNLKKKSVPIVQASGHSLGVGSLLLDVKDNGSVSVVDYKLHQITPDIIPEPQMSAFVEAAIRKRDQVFNMQWNEVVGESQIAVSGYANGHPTFRTSCWGSHFATAARLATGASVGVHASQFEGLAKPAGTITFGDIIDSFPHVRKFGDQGWEIVTTTVPALQLKAVMYWISRRGYGVNFSGLGYKDIPDNAKGSYTIAFPAEAVLAINRSFPKYKKYLQGLKYSGKYYWPVMRDYIKKNSPLKCR